MKSNVKAYFFKALLGIGALVLVVSLLSIPASRTSTTEYCMSCHEMEVYKAELDKSPHAADENGNAIECSQCHIPNKLGPKYLAVKAISGARDLWVHNFGDPENLDRRHLQGVARRYILDENCQSCHQDLFQNTQHEAISEIGKLSHEAYLGINGSTKRKCTGCHLNMAHLPDFDRRFEFNTEFSKNLPLVQE